MLVLLDSRQIPRPSKIVFEAICIDEENGRAEANERYKSYIRQGHYVAANEHLDKHGASNNDG